MRALAALAVVLMICPSNDNYAPTLQAPVHASLSMIPIFLRYRRRSRIQAIPTRIPQREVILPSTYSRNHHAIRMAFDQNIRHYQYFSLWNMFIDTIHGRVQRKNRTPAISQPSALRCERRYPLAECGAVYRIRPHLATARRFLPSGLIRNISARLYPGS